MVRRSFQAAFVNLATALLAPARPHQHIPSSHRHVRPFVSPPDPRRVHHRFCRPRSLSASSPSPKSTPTKMSNIIRVVTNSLSHLISFAITLLAVGTPLRRFFIPLLGRPTGTRGALLARFVLPVLNRTMLDAILVAAAPPPQARVLELGFANGDLLQRLLDAGVKAPVYGLDVTDDMVTLARTRLGRNAVLGNSDIQDDGLVGEGLTYGELFGERDCEMAGFSSREQVAPFDIVLMVNVFYFFSDEGIHVAARNLWKLVRDGGRVFTVSREREDPDTLRDWGFEGNISSERYIDAMREAGFEVHKDGPSTREHVTIVATKSQQ